MDTETNLYTHQHLVYRCFSGVHHKEVAHAFKAWLIIHHEDDLEMDQLVVMTSDDNDESAVTVDALKEGVPYHESFDALMEAFNCEVID